MNRVADVLTEFLIVNQFIEVEEKEIYKYGFLSGIELMVCLLINIILALHGGNGIEFLIVVLVFAPLRSYVGGLHLKTYSSCLICTTFIINLVLEIASSIQIPVLYSIIVCFLSVFIILKLANSDKSARNYEIIYFRNQSFKIVFIIILVWTFFLLSGRIHYANIVLITLCIIAMSNILEKMERSKKRSL